MGTLTIPNSIEAGQARNASPIKENFDAIATAFNGNIDATNLKDGAATAAKIGAAAVTADKLGANVTAQTWHAVGGSGEPAFANSWVNYGGSEVVAAFCKDALGFVHLRGTVKGGTIGAAIFTLPVGYRPATIHVYPAYSTNGAGTPVAGVISIASDGVVTAAKGDNAVIGISIPPFYAG